MRRLMRPAMTRPALLLLLVAAVTLPAIADKAKSLYAKGEDAEARQKYEEAYDFFKQAYDLKPKDLRYRTSFERIRFEAAASIVHKGQKLRDDGKLDEAPPPSRKPWTSIRRCSSPNRNWPARKR
jgi:tetratricopeptide (TPR) repeat protein